METLLIVALVAGAAWLALRGSVARRRAEADEYDSGWSTLRWIPAFLFIGAVTHGADPGPETTSLPHGDSWGGDVGGSGGDGGGFGGGGD